MPVSIPIPPAPRDEPELVVLDAVPTAVVRHADVRMERIREVFDTSFAALGGSGVAPAGPAFAVYRGDPADQFDVEVGFPLAERLPAAIPVGDLTVEPSALPDGRAVTLSHVGGYDGLGDAWARLFSGVVGGGLRPGEAIIEVYVTEPTPDADPAGMRTDLFVTLAERR